MNPTFWSRSMTHVEHSRPIHPPLDQKSPALAVDRAVPLHQCACCLHNTVLQDILLNTCLVLWISKALDDYSTGEVCHPLCITLPNASSTDWDVKFSEGMRLMKCFCLRFSYVPCDQSCSSEPRTSFKGVLFV